MLLGILILAVVAGRIFAGDIFWELVTGLALIASISALVQFELGMAAFGLLVSLVCILHWKLVA